MQPSPEDFAEWQQLPVSEWIFAIVERFAGKQKALWADMAWDGELDPLLLKEAKVRADCYSAIKDSDYADWKAIDDSED